MRGYTIIRDTGFYGVDYFINRYLYWSDWGGTPTIERSHLDGSQIKKILDQDLGFPNGLTIDYKDRRLYWTDALKNRIDTADLNGQHRVQLIPGANNPFGLTQVSLTAF